MMERGAFVALQNQLQFQHGKKSPTIQITVDSSALDSLPEALRAAIARAVEKTTRQLRDLVELNIRSPFGSKPPAVRTGTLASSVIVSLFGQDAAAVVLGKPADAYGVFVELGTRPRASHPKGTRPQTRSKNSHSNPTAAIHTPTHAFRRSHQKARPRNPAGTRPRRRPIRALNHFQLKSPKPIPAPKMNPTFPVDTSIIRQVSF